MSNLVAEVLLRLIKPLLAVFLGAIVYLVATALGEPGSISLALLSFLVGTGFILLVQEGPI
jgi:hypothetical protein